MQRTTTTTALALASLLSFAACGGNEADETYPTFSLAWSEYPSWSVFGVADELGMIEGKKGEMGPIEAKWKVDIELKEADYDSCITYFGSATADAACLTNMDTLSPSTGRRAVGILPTSTSKGADALLVVGIDDVKDLKGKPVYGLEKSVSEYTFVRNLELLGENEDDYAFTNMDPAAAALGMQQAGEGSPEAIVVWNPFVMDTLAKRKGSKVLFSSATIPGEIIDMVVMGADSLEKEGGDRFACAVIDTFYEFSRRLEDPEKRQDMLVGLGEKFSDLDASSMEAVLEMTIFYDEAAKGIALFEGQELKDTMTKVTEFCASHDMVDAAPALGYGAGASGEFIFDPTFMKRVRDN